MERAAALKSSFAKKHHEKTKMNAHLTKISEVLANLPAAYSKETIEEKRTKIAEKIELQSHQACREEEKSEEDERRQK